MNNSEIKKKNEKLKMKNERLMTKDLRLKAITVDDILAKEFPTVDTPLIHKNDFELLVATILSAQTLDTTTNKVTPALFSKYPTPQDLSKANLEDVDSMIHNINYHRTKSKNIIKTSQILLDKFNGKVPSTMEELTQLAGVGRKVANVVISEWFAKREGVQPVGYVVDTHVKRVSYRLGLTEQKTPEKIEQDLMKTFPKDRWVNSSLRMIFHGRKTCKSQVPLCSQCPLREMCPKKGVTIRN